MAKIPYCNSAWLILQLHLAGSVEFGVFPNKDGKKKLRWIHKAKGVKDKQMEINRKYTV